MARLTAGRRRVVVQGLPGRLDRLQVVAGEAGRVVLRVADHRQDGAGPGVERDDGAALVAQRLVGGLLRGRVDRQLQAGAALHLAGEHVDHAAVEQLVGGAGEQGVLGPLDAAAGAVREGVVAGDLGVELALGVGADELQLVLGGHRLGDRLAVDEDRAALAGVAREQGAAVVAAVVQRLGLDELDPRGGDQQRAEQGGDDHRQAADRGVHRILTTSVWAAASGLTAAGDTSGRGRRAWSLIRSSRATRDQFASRDEPP